MAYQDYHGLISGNLNEAYNFLNHLLDQVVAKKSRAK
jgi:hypothetical protein